MSAITMICGIPGHGKTLYAVSRVAADALRDGRQVYYHGIPDCTVPGWKLLDDVRQWFALPAKSIVVVDEAHQFFPQRGPSAPVPEFVGMTAVVRRLGIDLILITQDGNSIDHFVRRRCGRYLHIWRPMGLARSTVWEFGKFGDWEDSRFRLQAVRHAFPYPKASYALYKSAEVHTVKMRVPLKLWLLPVLVVAAVVLIVWAFKNLVGGTLERADTTKENISKSVAAVGSVGRSVSASSSSPASPAEYLKARIPRFVDVPESAPWFDSLVQPRAFPVVAGCIASSVGCTCYSQQGTRLDRVSAAVCLSFVQHGAFDPYREKESARRVPSRQDGAGSTLAAPPGTDVPPVLPHAERVAAVPVAAVSAGSLGKGQAKGRGTSPGRP